MCTLSQSSQSLMSKEVPHRISQWIFRLEAICWISSITLLRKIVRVLQIIVWITRELSISSSELHTFCSHKDSQSKAPILLCKSLSSYRKKVKLTFELQGKCMIFGVPHSFPLIYQKQCKFAGPFLHPLQAVHSEL